MTTATPDPGPPGFDPSAMPRPLPTGWTASTPSPDDVHDLAELLRRHEAAARGRSSAAVVDVTSEVLGRGGATREHVVLADETGRVRGWATAHDRAAGRVMLAVTVDPDLPSDVADDLAADLFAWGDRAAVSIGADRDLEVTQIDSGAFADDHRQHAWLGAAGFAKARSWWQMSRPVTLHEGEPGAFPDPKEGVTIRRVEQGWDAMPDEDDLRAVHDVLEDAFADHFNSHEEEFDEFVARLREDPGHRWDHWWLAELTDDAGGAVPAGALVATASPGGTDGEGEPQPAGSYVAYIGVLQNARGRGVAKSLLHAVIADAAQRGRNRVGLEVDADSPTGADSLYTSMGWETSYVTESWHRDVPVNHDKGAASNV